LDTSRVSQDQYIQLLVKVYKRKGKRLELSIDQPFPEITPIVYKPKNIVRIALDVKAYLTINPDASYTTAAGHYNVTRARISQLVKIINNLPAHLNKKLDETEDPILLRRFSGKQLLKLASFETRDHMQQAIDSIMPSSCEETVSV
jgi:hypothetical protein